MLYLLIAAGVVLLETKVKDYIEDHKEFGKQQEILNGKIIVKKHYNRGMMLNFLEDKKEMVKTITGIFLGLLLLLFTVALPKKGNKLYKLGLALCVGGAISNVSDRFNRGYVVDYFSFNYKKLKNIVFNLADMFILLGSFLIFISSVFFTKGKSSSDETAE
ncbi:MAG: putative rane protein [Herbinix sp.]|jgi:signal peptidase II|nr:putative rane protein [Herbinix sp.]